MASQRDKIGAAAQKLQKCPRCGVVYVGVKDTCDLCTELLWKLPSYSERRQEMGLTAEDEEWMNAPMGPYTQGVYPEPPRSSAGKVTQPLKFSEVEADLWASQEYPWALLKDHQYIRLPGPRKLLDNPSAEMSWRAYKDELLRKEQERKRRLQRAGLVFLGALEVALLVIHPAVGILGALVGLAVWRYKK